MKPSWATGAIHPVQITYRNMLFDGGRARNQRPFKSVCLFHLADRTRVLVIALSLAGPPLVWHKAEVAQAAERRRAALTEAVVQAPEPLERRALDLPLYHRRKHRYYHRSEQRAVLESDRARYRTSGFERHQNSPQTQSSLGASDNAASNSSSTQPPQTPHQNAKARHNS